MLVFAMPHPCIIPWNEANARRHDKGFMLPFVNESCGANQLRLHVSVINPGEAAHPPHQHAGEEIIFVFEGEGEATRITGAAFNKDPGFYRLTKSLEAYKAAFGASNTVILVDPSTEFMKTMMNP